MNTSDTPRPYEEWRTDSLDRAEDAAYTFGYHLMQHCRGEALRAVEFAAVPTSAEEFRARVNAAVDTALHNVMALLEGFWPTQAGPNHRVAYALSVCIGDVNRTAVDRIAAEQRWWNEPGSTLKDFGINSAFDRLVEIMGGKTCDDVKRKRLSERRLADPSGMGRHLGNSRP